MNGTRWFPDQKPVVGGRVRWPQASFSRVAAQKGHRLTTSGYPVGPFTGSFPAAAFEPAAAYPEASRSIRPFTTGSWLPDSPHLRKKPECVPNEPIGIATNGVLLLPPSDGLGQDLAAREVGDQCAGTVTEGGLYGYRTGSSCLNPSALRGGHSGRIGWVRDGFGIYGPRGSKGKRVRVKDLDECHGHTHRGRGGKSLRKYHYHATADFPYLIGCFRGKRWPLKVDARSGVDTTKVSITPSTYPSFDPKVSDYYIADCAGGPVHIEIETAAGESASVEGEGPFSGNISRDIPLAGGQGFSYVLTKAGDIRSYRVRCLPSDFPDWTFDRLSQPDQEFYVVSPLVVPSNYVIIFDHNGVPVWYQKPSVPGFDAKVLSDRTVAWARWYGGGFGNDPNTAYEIHRLDGTLARVVKTVGSTTDVHEIEEVGNGNLMLITYKPRDHVDLSPYFGPSDATGLDGEIQEIDPQGNVVWSWNSKDHVALDESSRWITPPTPIPLADGRTAYDLVHMNSIERVGDLVIASLAYADAIYGIDRTTGDIEWKIGGTTTAESLDLIDDPFEGSVFGLQHDPRLLPDGTVTVHDNGGGRPRSPRAVRYRLDLTARTATLIESVEDPEVPTPSCCGSARRSPSGSWLMAWGGNPLVTEFDASGTRTFRLNLSPGFSYRAHPVPVGFLDRAALWAGMQAMNPR